MQVYLNIFNKIKIYIIYYTLIPGKSSTFKMLTGLLDPTYGTAYLNNFNIKTDKIKVTYTYITLFI